MAPLMMLTQTMKHHLTDVSPDVCSVTNSSVDEVEDGCHKDDPADHLLLQVGLPLMNSMVFITIVVDGRCHCHWSMIVMMMVVVAGAHSGC